MHVEAGEPAEPTTIPERFHEKINDFALYRRNKTSDFVGREFLFREIAAFTERHSSGYVLIEGDPGFGKTTFLAELVARNPGHPFHFNIRAEGINRIDQFLENVCAQLIVGHDLPAAQDVFQEPKVFHQLLAKAARSRGGGTMFLVVDALDEVDRSGHPLGNILGLPTVLPEGVFVVTSSRRNGIKPMTDEPMHHCDIAQDNPDHLADIRAYIAKRCDRDGIAGYRGRHAMREVDFIDLLTEKSQGNFMYLRHVLRAIEAGDYDDFDTASLPTGLTAYYEDHWRRMHGRGREISAEEKVRVLVALAIVEEPVDLATLTAFSGLERQGLVGRVLEIWNEFLYTDRENDRKRYRIYHTSFQEFIAEKDGIKGEMVDLKRAHAAISDVMWDQYLADRKRRGLSDL